MNIVLIGPRWSGKTEAGRILAARTCCRFIDTDDMVEQMAGVSINTLVRDDGWEGFRDMEALAVRRAALGARLVIATGGGVVTRAENVHFLRRNGWIVWLKASEETLKKRMSRDSGAVDTRPSLHGIDPAEEIRRVLRERTPQYCHAGDLSVETDELTPFEVTDLIMAGTPQKLKR